MLPDDLDVRFCRMLTAQWLGMQTIVTSGSLSGRRAIASAVGEIGQSAYGNGSAAAVPPKKNLAASSSTSTYAAPSMAAHLSAASLSASGPSYLPLRWRRAVTA